MWRFAKAGVPVVAVAGALALVTLAPAAAQQINNRSTADPGSNAQVSRLVTRGALQAAEATGDTLKRDDLSDVVVNTDCGPVSIGGTKTQEPGDAEDEDSLLRRGTSADAETTTVVRGSVVNICRR